MQNELVQKSIKAGLVVSYYGKRVAVEMDNGQVIDCHLRRNQPLPVVGDRVNFTYDDKEAGIITSILPRRSILARGDARGKLKPIAANVDNIVIVMAPAPIFSHDLVDRYLVAAEVLKINPVIVINKLDLLNQAAREQAEATLAVYRNISYQVALTSMKTKEGECDLAPMLAGKVSVLVGPSGVGKSTIISSMTDEDIRTNLVSDKGIGKHTTTASRYYHLKQGGGLIDSPGVRDFQLWPVSRKEILKGFKEFQPYLSGCRFRDCQHIVEPDCRLLAALEAGKIDSRRFEHFKAMTQGAGRDD